MKAYTTRQGFPVSNACQSTNPCSAANGFDPRVQATTIRGTGPCVGESLDTLVACAPGGRSSAIGTWSTRRSFPYALGASFGRSIVGAIVGVAGGGVDDGGVGVRWLADWVGLATGAGVPVQAEVIGATSRTSQRETAGSGRRIARMLPADARRLPDGGPGGYSPAMTELDLTPKPVSSSQVTLVQLMEITDANIGGIVHGGTVMKLVDTAAGLAAMKHCGGVAVTVSMDSMSFLAPVRIGDTLTVNASVNDVGKTSLEVGVRVESEKVITGERTHMGSAYLVFVALDEEGVPRSVPPIVAETSTERRRQREAKIRRKTRLEHKQAILEHRDRTERGPEPTPAPTPTPTPPESDDGTEPGVHSRRHLRI